MGKTIWKRPSEVRVGDFIDSEYGEVEVLAIALHHQHKERKYLFDVGLQAWDGFQPVSTSLVFFDHVEVSCVDKPPPSNEEMFEMFEKVKADGFESALKRFKAGLRDTDSPLAQLYIDNFIEGYKTGGFSLEDLNRWSSEDSEAQT